MAADGDDVTAVFHDISDLEKEFADVELDALRRKEFHLKPLYTKREALLKRVPQLWPQVFLNGPEEIQQLSSAADMGVLSAIKSFYVERYQLISDTEGEPRSLRFTFEFEDNEYFEDKKLVKEFEYKKSDDGPGHLLSKPVPIKWKSRKTDLTNGLLDAAIELYRAEEALGQDVEPTEREALWQYEKLRDKIEQAEEESEDEPSFLNWFGFRGAVAEAKAASKAVRVDVNGGRADGEPKEEEVDEEDDDDDDGVLEVEIFPAGEEVAVCLADGLWPSVMDYFMRAQEESEPDFEEFDEEGDGIDEIEVDSDGVPELVENVDKDPVAESRPTKRQRTG